MSPDNYPSIEFVQQALEYRDGKLFWRERPREHFKREKDWKTWRTLFAGVEAGCLMPDPRARDRFVWRVGIRGKAFLRHVIVWAIHHGEWHLGLDHIDRDSLNDRIENLRTCTQSQNQANRRTMAASRSGYRGVTWSKLHKKWRVRITIDGRRTDLGLFDDPAVAHAVYAEVAQEHFGEFYADV